MQVHVSKPVKRVVLLRALHLALGGADGRAAVQVTGFGMFEISDCEVCCELIESIKFVQVPKSAYGSGCQHEDPSVSF